MDGATHWQTLWKIYFTTFKTRLSNDCAISYPWLIANEWFSGIIFMNSPENYPLSSYLQTVVVNRGLTTINATDIGILQDISDRTTKGCPSVFRGFANFNGLSIFTKIFYEWDSPRECQRIVF